MRVGPCLSEEEIQAWSLCERELPGLVLSDEMILFCTNVGGRVAVALEETARMERERRAVQVGAPHSPSPPRPQHPPHPLLTQEERRRLEQVRRQEAAAYQERMEGEARRGLDQEYRGKREEMLRAREEVEALLGLLAAHRDQISAALGNLDTEYQGLAAAPLHPTQLPALATPLPRSPPRI